MTTHRKTQNKSSASQNHSFFCKYRASAPWCSSLFAPSINYITAKTKYHFFLQVQRICTLMYRSTVVAHLSAVFAVYLSTDAVRAKSKKIWKGRKQAHFLLPPCMGYLKKRAMVFIAQRAPFLVFKKIHSRNWKHHFSCAWKIQNMVKSGVCCQWFVIKNYSTTW